MTVTATGSSVNSQRGTLDLVASGMRLNLSESSPVE